MEREREKKEKRQVSCMNNLVTCKLEVPAVFLLFCFSRFVGSKGSCYAVKKKKNVANTQGSSYHGEKVYMVFKTLIIPICS